MKLSITTINIVVILAISSISLAECPLDHFIIGCNRDGVVGTDDDRKLFVDCRQKYRDSGSIEYDNWFYPLHKSIFPSYPYRLGEPGFDAFQDYNPNASYTYDPNRCFPGEPDTDYRIIVECLSLSPGLRIVHKDYPQFTIDEAGGSFNHSYIFDLRGDPHMHLSYQAVDGENLHWVTYCVYDEFADPNDPNHLEPSEPFTIVFNREPLAGDLVVDGMVDIKDLAEFSYYWLGEGGDKVNDYYERTDANRDGLVDFLDFALLASNWQKAINDENQDIFSK
ncbi:MAG: dockerin type I domain-containing protein [Phycisphaerales bacterium]|jgi:hypothetical protein